MTYTYAELEISEAAFDEIAKKLKEADWGHVFMKDGRLINMDGVALVREDVLSPPGTKL